MRFSDVERGTAVCDMHNGLESIHADYEERIEVINHISLNGEGGSAFIQRLIAPRSYTNKYLVVVDENPQADGSSIYKCMYSYDDRTFGIVSLRVTPRPPPLRAPAPVPVPKLTVRRDVGTRQFEADPGTSGSPIVGRGASILEAVGEYAIQSGLVTAVAYPPERIDDSYRVDPNINAAKLVLIGCDRR